MDSKDEVDENEYLEMSNHFKKVYDEMEIKILNHETTIKELKKEIITSYGFIRVIDNLLENLYDVPNEIIVLIECLRGHLSNIIDKEIKI